MPLSSNVSSTASANLKKPTATAKTLQFTPKNSVPRVAKRESLSAVKEKTVKSSEDSSPFKLPSKATDAHIKKKEVAPARTGRMQPSKLSLPPVRPAVGASMNRPAAAGNSSLLRPGGPIKASHSANASLSKANTSGIPKSGLERPTLIRTGES